MFDMDEGSVGSKGPWISWKARGNRSVSRERFEHRDEDGNKSEFQAIREHGVIVDIDNLRTGWCHSTGQQGVAPEWRWNDTPARMAPKPGDDYKKGLSVPVAIGGGQTATWEDSSAGAWQGFVALKDELKRGSRQHPGKLPMIRLDGATEMRFGKGDTAVPQLTIVKWVDRPQCLDADLIDEGEPEQAAPPAPAPRQPQQPRRQPSQRAVAAATAAQAPAFANAAPDFSPSEEGGFIDDEIPF